jgi:2,3-dihydroxybenzoate decarboxylase/5-carboxyvanillate decarboxylase
MFDADTATELAQLFNDRLAEVVARHPRRYAGLAAFAPQSPKRAAREIERAMTSLRLNGLLVNSHTNDEYYDQEKYYPIFEAAESLDAAIYLHPRAPMMGLDRPFDKYWMEAALWGYGVETSTHALRLIFCGLFDRFPKLKIVLGHMGEGLPFWLTRLDFMHDEAVITGNAPKLQLTPSEYFRRNFVITTSGQENHLALKYSLDMLGDDNVMWAIDYPYQPMESAVRFMEAAPISDLVKAKVFGETAARIFQIK